MPHPWLKPGVIVGALVPLAAIGVRAATGKLGADPVASVENELGLAALILLVASLACSPAGRLLHWTWAVRIRRELGLLAFMYASLHFLTYLIIDQGVDLSAIVADIVERPFITVGFTALAVVHFIWRVKIDVSQPLTYACVLGILLLARAIIWIRLHRNRRLLPN